MSPVVNKMIITCCTAMLRNRMKQMTNPSSHFVLPVAMRLTILFSPHKRCLMTPLLVEENVPIYTTFLLTRISMRCQETMLALMIVVIEYWGKATIIVPRKQSIEMNASMAICQSSQIPDALGISIVVDKSCERPNKTPVIWQLQPRLARSPTIDTMAPLRIDLNRCK